MSTHSLFNVDLNVSWLRSISEQFGSPFYLYDLDEVEYSASALRRMLPKPHTLFYSIKANPNQAVLQVLAGLGIGAEVSSRGELRRAVAAGFRSDDILFTGPGKSTATIESALDVGCRISAESFVELRCIDQLARVHPTGNARCLLRLNLVRPPGGGGLAISGGASKFGIDIDVLTRASLPAISVVKIEGMHVFQATNLHDRSSLMHSFAAAAAGVARACGELELEPTLVDLGGGFPAPYASERERAVLDLTDDLAKILDEHFPGWSVGRPRIAYESGRYLCGTAGRLISTVIDVKNSGGRRFVIIDSGIHHLGGMSGLRRLPALRARTFALERASNPLKPATVVGPLCTPLDTWHESFLPIDVRPGDLLVVENVGAYGLSASLLGFLSHDPPAEVIVSNGKVVMATRTTLADVSLL